MAFGPIKSKRKRQKVAAYDLEWDSKTGDVTLAGFYVDNHYRAYLTVGELLKAMFVDQYVGTFFYAHSGGRHDMTQLVVPLSKLDFEIDCHVVGSRIILAIVRDKNDPKRVWYLADSLAVLKASLAAIGDAIGLPKIAGDTDGMSPRELYLRNKRDCEIVVKALESTQTFLWERGGELKHTIGACGMTLVRRAYLKKTLITRKDDNLWARGAYHSARVEVFKRIDSDGLVRDINSAFPWAITQGLPGERIRIDKTIPEDNPDAFWCADCVVTVPDGHIPPLPFRTKGRIYFPTGTFRTKITRVMYELLREYGGTVDTVYEVHHYAQGLEELSAYVLDMYNRRKATKDPFERMQYKYLMNTVYGKLAERSAKSGLIINPPDLLPIERMLTPGVYRTSSERNVDHEHVIAAVWITDMVKALLTRELWRYKEAIAYCDTDCVHGPDLGFPSSDELGEWKHEERYTRGERLAPKLYALTLGDGRHKIAAKGFAKPSYEQFKDLERGLARDFEWFATPREAMANLPLMGKRRKGLSKQCPVCYRHLDTFGQGCPEHGLSALTVLVSGKRAADGKDGETRPWRVSELVGDRKAA